jgi:Ni/Co efflux regulator RcnB
VKRLAILMAIACLAMPAMAGAQGHDHRDHGGGGRGESHERGGGGRGGGYPGGYRDDRGGPPGPGYGYPGPRVGGGYGGYGGGFGGGAPHSYQFVRGQRLPPEYRGYVVNDYGAYHLRRPPRGYYWYRAGDDFVLAALGSGLIFEVINAEGY